MERELSWKASPLGYAERSLIWYAVLAAITFILMGIAVWQNNPFFAVFVGLAAVLVGVVNRRRHPAIEFRIGAHGIVMGETEYPYTEFTEFTYRRRDDRLDEVLLRKKSIFGSHIHLPVDRKLGANVRAYLSEHLEETDHEESFLELFSDLLGI